MKTKFLTKLIAGVLAFVGLSGVSSCAKKVDYISREAARLTLDYKGRDFYKDGIGQVTLRTAIDGDTAHFVPTITTTSRENIKARFYGIDTPESTGKVQPWGKAASNFTKEKLTEANENGTIVVSSAQDTYKVPNVDSTGQRYVCLVWVNLEKKDADMSELILLNLWLVQEGYSNVKNVADLPQYVDIFYEAEAQAQKLKLVMFSGKDDPLYNAGEYVDTSLLDIKREIEKSLADETHVNAYDNVRVRIQGTVAGFSNNILYLQNFYTAEEGAIYPEGEYAGINVFTSMASPPSRYIATNAYIELCGLAQDSDNFGFQVTDAKFSVLGKGEYDAKVIISPEDNTEEHKLYTFEYEPSQLVANNYASLFCSVKVTKPVTVNRVYVASNSEITLYLENCAFSIYIAFMYRVDGVIWNTEAHYLNKSFNITGVYTFHKTASGNITWQINPSSAGDLVVVPAQE